MAVAVQTNISPVDALWTLIQGQSKTVRHALAKRLNASIEAEKEPKVKMTEAEFYAKLDRSIENTDKGPVFTMLENETGEQFINRLLSTEQ